MANSMKGSMKSSGAEKKEYNYIIHSHGAIFTSLQENVKKYMAINIPENVELFTYTTFGKVVVTNCKKNYFICDNLDKVEAKYKNSLFKIEKPTHKYKYKEGTQNIFPEAMLIPDTGPILKFYSGIVHCIPHANRTSSIKGMEIIHNMDANNAKDCADDSIRKYYKYTDAEDKQKLYDTNTNYSEHYKELIKTQGNKREAPLDTINKCGAILLSEAIKIIQAHCEKKYGVNNTIKIYLNFCLGEMNIEEYGEDKNYYLRENKDEVIEFMTQNKKTLTPEQIDRLYYDYLDYHSLDTESIISNNLHATNLEEFAKNLDTDYVADIQDSFSYDYVYDNKNFKLIFSKTSTHELDTAKYHKYDMVNSEHYLELIDKVIRKLCKYVASWHIDYSELPNNITIDVREFEQPTKDDIFKKLIHTLTLMVEKLQTTLKFNSKKKTWQLVVNLLHDDYLENENNEYDNKIFRVIERIFEPIQTTYKNMLSKIVNFNLKLSVLKESEDELYKRLEQQIIEQSELEKATQAKAAAAREKELSDLAEQEAAAARQKRLIDSVREDAEKAAREDAEKAAREEAEKAAREEAEKAAREEAEKAAREDAEKAARKAARKAAKKAAKKAAEEAEEEARKTEEARKAQEEEARKTEEEAKKAQEEAAKAAAKSKRSLSQRLMSSFARSSRRVAPESMTTSNSQTKKLSMSQQFKSIFNPKSTRVAPAPDNTVGGNIKTKFKRKHRKRITRRHRIKNISINRPLYKIKAHSMPVSYDKKTFKKLRTPRRKYKKPIHYKKNKIKMLL